MKHKNIIELIFCRIRYLLYLLLFFGSVNELTSQEIKFVATSPQKVSVGSRFNVSYSINAQGSNLQLPSFRDFRLLSGPNQSQSQSMQFINGQMSQSINISYSYILEPLKEGTFTIPSASIVVSGKTYKSNNLTIEVVKGNVSQQTPQGNRNSSQTEPQVSSKDIFLSATANKSNPYQGEEVIISYKLYFNIPILQYGISKSPASVGFWVHELTDKKGNPNQYRDTYNGREYQVADIRKVAVYAQKSGKLSIEPLKMDIVAQFRQKRQSNDFWDDFFGNVSVQNKKIDISSNYVNINVKPLPEPRPATFTGSVGNYSISCVIDKTEAKTNEPITLTFSVSGKGNLKILDPPVFEFPNDFEVYDPKINDKITANVTGVSGTRTFQYLIIPRNPGKYNIKSINFAYFEPNKGIYSNFKTSDFILNIEKGKDYKAQTSNNVNQKEINLLNSDIRYIKTNNISLFDKENVFFLSIPYWILLLLPLTLFTIFIFVYRNQIKKRRNKVLLRNKKASRIAKNRLKKANFYLEKNDKENFYLEISHSILNYIADKFNIPLSKLSKDTITRELNKINLSELMIDELILVIDDCEFARFAPGEPSSMMNLIYQRVYKIFIEFEKELKKSKI